MFRASRTEELVARANRFSQTQPLVHLVDVTRRTLLQVREDHLAKMQKQHVAHRMQQLFSTSQHPVAFHLSVTIAVELRENLRTYVLITKSRQIYLLLENVIHLLVTLELLRIQTPLDAALETDRFGESLRFGDYQRDAAVWTFLFHPEPLQLIGVKVTTQSAVANETIRKQFRTPFLHQTRRRSLVTEIYILEVKLHATRSIF